MKRGVLRVKSIGLSLRFALFVCFLSMFSVVAYGDLSQYPAPFGLDSSLIVVGSKAASSDVVGGIDIAATLPQMGQPLAASALQTGPSGSNAQGPPTGAPASAAQGPPPGAPLPPALRPVDEDVVSKRGEFEISDLFVMHMSTADKSALRSLAPGTISNQFGETTYTQFVELPTPLAGIRFALDPDDDEEIPQYYVYTPANIPAYVYRLNFLPALKTQHRNESVDYLDGLEGKQITLLGKRYTVAKTYHDSQYSLRLVLLGGEIEGILEEGQTKEFVLDDKQYSITAHTITDTANPRVELEVNGELTSGLKEGDVFRLEDETLIGVERLYANEAGDVTADFVRIFVGAEVLEIEDSNTIVDNLGGTIQVDHGFRDTQLKRVSVDIMSTLDQGVSDRDEVEISGIQIQYSPSGDLYIPVGSSLSERAALLEDQPRTMFSDNFDLEFRGMTNSFATKDVFFEASGEYNYRVSFTNLFEQPYSFRMIGCTSRNCSSVAYGRLDGDTFRDLVFSETEMISDEEMFIVTGDRASHVLKYKSFDEADREITIEDVSTKERYELTFNASVGELEIDGYIYQVNVSGRNITVDMNSDGDFGDVNNLIYLTSESYIELSTTDENLVNITGEQRTDVSTQDEIQIGFSWRSSDTQLDVNDSLTKGFLYGFDAGKLQVGGDQIEEGVTAYGLLGRWDRRDEDRSTFLLKMPRKQLYADLWVTGVDTPPVGVPQGETSGDLSSAASGTGSSTSVEWVGVEGLRGSRSVSYSRLDTEFTEMDRAQKHVISIGGPCSNSVTAEVMGYPEPCDKDFEKGTALIRLYENAWGEKTHSVLVIAGHSAEDTRRAARMLKDYETAALSGEEILLQVE